MENIKGIIFDYGGTIDSRGVHWSEVIWAGYQANAVPVDKSIFRDAYVFAERELARTSVLHELESVVKEKRNNDNIDDISEADRAELIRYYVKIV